MEASTTSPPLAAARSSTAIGVLRAVHAEPGITRARLARELDISSGLASETVARLVASGVVAEGPARATGSRGRPTGSLGPHPRGPVAAVAAISHESWEVATVLLGGEVAHVPGATPRSRPVLGPGRCRGRAEWRLCSLRRSCAGDRGFAARDGVRDAPGSGAQPRLGGRGTLDAGAERDRVGPVPGR